MRSSTITGQSVGLGRTYRLSRRSARLARRTSVDRLAGIAKSRWNAPNGADADRATESRPRRRMTVELEFDRGEPVIFSPLGLSQWFNGFCATLNSREIGVEQKPLNHRRKVGGETITRSKRPGHFTNGRRHTPRISRTSISRVSNRSGFMAGSFNSSAAACSPSFSAAYRAVRIPSDFATARSSWTRELTCRI